MRIFVIAMLFLAAREVGTAQEAPLDLATVVQTALRSHPSLRVAAARSGEAVAMADEARAAAAPKLSAALSYTRLQEDPSFRAGGLGAMSLGGRDNRGASVSLQYPIYSGGRIGAAVQGARAMTEASGAALLRLRQEVALNATVAFFGVLKARGAMEAALAQARSLESQRDSLARLLDEGVSTRIELLRSETALSAARETLARARNEERTALAALASAMGVETLPSLNLVDPRTDAGTQVVSLEVEEPLQKALASRPEMRQLEAQARAAEAQIQAARARSLPEVGLFAQYDATRPSYQPRTGAWSAGVGLSMSLFDGGAARAGVRQAEARLAGAQAALAEMRNTIRLQVARALANLRSARERLAVAESGRITAEEGLRLMEIGYRSGVNTLTDYLASEAERARALNDRVTALYDLRVAEAELKFALGE